MREYFIDQPVQWYKDNKLMIGIVIVVISFILGLWGKVLIVAELYRPVELMTGISVYAFSWILLFLGAFIVGWRTVRRIRQRINHHVKKTYRHAKSLPGKGYDHAKRLHRKGYNHAKNLHRKSMDSLSTASKTIAEKIRQK